MTQPFYSVEFRGRTMSRFGVVLDVDAKQCSQEVTRWVMQEAVRAGWKLEKSGNRDEGLVWTPPKDNL